MKLTIKRMSGTPLDVELIGHIERRTEFALGRVGLHVQQVRIGLEDLNGPRGGIDKCCQVQLVLAGEAPLVVSETSADEYAAVNRALSVASHLAERRIARRREHARGTRTQMPAIVG